MKYLWVLLILVPFITFGECNTAGISCSINSDCPANGTVDASWFYSPSGASFCDPSDCRMHQPTIRHPRTWTSAGNCAFPGTCFGATVIDYSLWQPAGDCINNNSVCTTGACTAFTPWINQGCAVNGCPGGQMSQRRNGTAPNCCTPASETQCVIDAACNVPIITAYTATPNIILLGDPVTLSWNTTSVLPVIYSVDQGVGVVAGNSIVVYPGAIGVITYTLIATNLAGNATSTAIVTVNPSPPRCGIGHLCGDVHATERPTQVLPKIVVQLRSSSGQPIQSVLTNNSGHYDFTVPNGTYMVSAVPDRLWCANPISRTILSNNIIGNADFTMRGVPALLIPSGLVGTFVLITTFSYTGASAPPVGAGIGNINWTITIDSIQPPRGMKVQGGLSYWMKCWKREGNGYVGGVSQSVAGGATLWPQDEITETCP